MTREQFELRNRIIEKVHTGRWRPEWAENVAERKNLGPLLENPNPADFDPMEEGYWSLPMALAWIMERTPQSVREHWDDYRLKISYWFYEKHILPVDGGTSSRVEEGWHIRQQEKITLLHMIIIQTFHKTEDAENAQNNIGFHTAKRDLWRALQDEKVTATALNNLSEIVGVSAEKWAFLDIGNDGEVDSLRMKNNMHEVAYTDVRVKRSQLIATWPPKEIAETVNLFPGGVTWVDLEYDDNLRVAMHSIEREKFQEISKSGAKEKPERGPADKSRGTKRKTKLQVKVLAVVSELWPDGTSPVRIDDRDNAIRKKWPSNETAPSSRTIRRALAPDKSGQ